MPRAYGIICYNKACLAFFLPGPTACVSSYPYSLSCSCVCVLAQIAPALPVFCLPKRGIASAMSTYYFFSWKTFLPALPMAGTSPAQAPYPQVSRKPPGRVTDPLGLPITISTFVLTVLPADDISVPGNPQLRALGERASHQRFTREVLARGFWKVVGEAEGRRQWRQLKPNPTRDRGVFR